MYPYWLLFGFFALGALIADGRSGPDDRRSSPGLVLGCVAIVVMVGLRDRVGVDWDNYVEMMGFTARRDIVDIFSYADPGYQILNWIAYHSGAGLWLVNLLCAAIFTWGLARFAFHQPFPWLALLIAIPYLVIVVAMNYTRQAVAIGFVMAGFASLTRGGGFFWRFGFYVVLGSLFHTSALLVLPMALIGQKRGRLEQLTLIPAGAYLLYTGLLSERVDKYVSDYISKAVESQGAVIRIAMCVLPAIVFLLARSRLRFESEEAVLWRNFSLAALALAALLFVLPSSTVVDRVALYVLPLQIAVLARMPFVLNSVPEAKIAVVAGSAAVLFVWLNFAFHASAWIPYRNFLL